MTAEAITQASQASTDKWCNELAAAESFDAAPARVEVNGETP